MTLTKTQIDKLTKTLKDKVKVDAATASSYLTEVQKPSSMKLKELELKIGKALAKNLSTKFGWANRPGKTGSVLVQAKTGIIVTRKSGDAVQRTEKVQHNTVGLIIFEKMKDHLLREEAAINHFYLDKNKHLTIGVGHLVDETADDMLDWPWSFKDSDLLPLETKTDDTQDTDKESTDEESTDEAQADDPASGGDREDKERPTVVTVEYIQADMDRVNSHPNSQDENLAASAYAKYTNLRLAESKMNELLEEDFKEERSKAVEEFPDMKTFPACVQFGLVDLTYLGGVKFDKFGKAIKRRDWPRTAKESEITKGSFSKKRNEKRKNAIEKGLESEPFFTTSPEKTEKLLNFLKEL